MYRLIKSTGTILWLFALLLGSCQPDPGTSANERAAREMFAAFNAHDWQKMSSYYSEQAQFLDPSLGKDLVVQTREQVIEKYSGLQSLFPDIKDELIGVYPCGDHVIIEFTSTGSSGDSIRLQLPIVSVLTFSGGLITKDATYYDLENP